jgi:putative flippase GtrA
VKIIIIHIADAWRRRTVLAKIFSYGSIGVVNTGVDISVFSIIFTFAQLPLILSNVIAWVVAMSCSYAMNSKITFGRETGGTLSWRHYLRFATSGILGAIIATSVLVILSHYTNIAAAKFASIVLAFGVNFFMSQFVVFRAAAVDTKG